MLPPWATTKRKSVNHDPINKGVRKLIFSTDPSLGQNHRLDLFLYTLTFTKTSFLLEGKEARILTPFQITPNQFGVWPLAISKQKNNHPSFSCPQACKAV
jgi:hypothetical protein